jgi:hypothetical protein
MKTQVTLLTMVMAGFLLFSTNLKAQEETYAECKYAFIVIDGQIDKRLKVDVDLGESEIADDLEDEYEDTLKGYHSHVQVIQFFIDKGYKVDQVFDQVAMSASGGGSEGIAVLFKKE